MNKVAVEVEVVTTEVRRESIPVNLLQDKDGDSRNSVLERIADYLGEEVVRADWTMPDNDDEEEED